MSAQTPSQVDEAIAEFRAFQARAAQPDRAPEPVIRVNGVAISADAVQREAQNHPADDPKDALEAAARALVVRELLLQEARGRNLTAVPERDEAGRSETEEDALIAALLDAEVVTPKADEETCRRYYLNNAHKFRSADLYEARHILIAADPADATVRAQARDLAERLIAELQADPSRFAELAAAYSACPSKEQGGNLGQLTQGQTVPEFETFLFNLEEGQLCPVPAETRFGCHVLKLDRKMPGRQLDFDLVHERIADYLETTSSRRAIAQYIGMLAGAARITGIDLPGADSPLVQ
jgi:peptidyl-prolyl cis-trans isomerase C